MIIGFVYLVINKFLFHWFFFMLGLTILLKSVRHQLWVLMYW